MPNYERRVKMKIWAMCAIFKFSISGEGQRTYLMNGRLQKEMRFNAVFILVAFAFLTRVSGHGAEEPDIIANTLENKYLWRCLDAASDPMYLKTCDVYKHTRTQMSFSISFVHQSYETCMHPIVIYGPGKTVLWWDKDTNTVRMNTVHNPENSGWCWDDSYFEDSFTLHPYNHKNKCLAAPAKDGDPVTVRFCNENSQQVAWSFLRSRPRPSKTTKDVSATSL
ncbi:8471_t:CDS:2 [Paraglomus occultum]|uniref:8471_t:CDS:1 n=1 Tax=Paraglomus occultum TaxID=144539 RepID=A0A9N9FFA2_9GLOM|nr:8471_t:CDS:2 [Paraglomus occultum]